ncbi:MAG TPA: hypothetical protein VEH04_16895 [Verrucomicrobiae bacterium]|nr:hypothetical protein [Verrucomicrobiae bacterium]
MSLPDTINGLFEFLAGFMVLNHCRVLYREKQVKGISTLSTAFFAAWGGWNLFYYPHLGQWLSFFGGLFIFAANLLWVAMLLHYRTRTERAVKELCPSETPYVCPGKMTPSGFKPGAWEIPICVRCGANTSEHACGCPAPSLRIRTYSIPEPLKTNISNALNNPL